ncbi:hypothetical protein [Agrobacterium bohemicum]|uniref:NmrA-like domain-containing protein n=1 Tax=Agrobacterium bohemicum TaxID=2052828 RepID=A0A135P6G1_9HYPH|nr:hypothetical protein [Agrobacterium bohemicum]KXG87025.1 hypothetical protein ATO67_21815 [Agrobacterium bohemicum]
MMGQIHEYLADHVPEWTVLRPIWFLQNFSHQQHQITIRQENTIYSATGRGRIGFIEAADIAERLSAHCSKTNPGTGISF